MYRYLHFETTYQLEHGRLAKQETPSRCVWEKLELSGSGLTFDALSSSLDDRRLQLEQHGTLYDLF